VISAPDVDSVYEVPLNFEKEQLGQRILSKFYMRSRQKDLVEWRKLVKTIKTVKDEVHVGIVGKYFTTGDFVLSDAYISVIEAVKHAAWHHNKKPVISWLNSEDYEKEPAKLKELKQFDGVIVPGGFGSRGVEGKIKAIQYCRENKIPYFGLCYGMQFAVVEFARNVCGLADANTTEVNPKTTNPVIHIMEEQRELLKDKKYGGTMRLGAYPCVLNKKSISYKAYGQKNISERHRHRYEFNNAYREQFEKAGMILAGTSPDNRLVEIIEVKDHPFFVGTQFHPEFKSRPLKPHPLFREFIAACLKK
jgi:CTP synthase